MACMAPGQSKRKRDSVCVNREDVEAQAFAPSSETWRHSVGASRRGRGYARYDLSHQQALAIGLRPPEGSEAVGGVQAQEVGESAATASDSPTSSSALAAAEQEEDRQEVPGPAVQQQVDPAPAVHQQVSHVPTGQQLVVPGLAVQQQGGPARPVQLQVRHDLAVQQHAVEQQHRAGPEVEQTVSSDGEVDSKHDSVL